jgi:uncharacterized protein involved in exopolysaccharide biosynthesis
MVRTPTLSEYIRIFSQYRWVILTTVVTSMVTTFWLSRWLPAVYEATTTLYVSQTETTILPADLERGRVRSVLQPGSENRVLRAYFGILRSETVARLAARRVPGREAWQIRRNTYVTMLAGGAFAVTARDREPAVASAVANALAVSANEMLNLRSGERFESNRRIVEEELVRAQADLGIAQEELRRFKERHGTISASEEATQLIKQKATLAADLDAVRVRLQELQVKIASSEQRLGGERRLYLSESVVSENPTIAELRTKLARLEVEAAGARAKFREAHPEIVRLRQEADEARRRLAEEAKTVVSSQTERLNPLYEHLRQSLVDSLIDQVTQQAKQLALETMLQGIDEKIRQHPSLAMELAERTRRVEVLEEILKKLNLRLAEAHLEERQALQPFVIIDEASTPDRPAFPNVLLSGILAGVVGAVASIFYALLLSYLSRARQPLVADLIRFLR